MQLNLKKAMHRKHNERNQVSQDSATTSRTTTCGFIATTLFCLIIPMFLSNCSSLEQNKNCSELLICKQKGLCHLKDETCVALTNEDCVSSRFCYSLGLCTLQGQSCIAATEKDCRGSEQCTNDRRCVPTGGICTEITEGWCRNKVDTQNQPTTCMTKGRCSLDSVNHQCIARNEKDCIASSECKEKGHCSLSGNTCTIQSDKDCAQSDLCKNFGQCHYIEKQLSSQQSILAQCVALSQADCNVQCSDEKGCIFDQLDSKCVSGTSFCKKSDACSLLGQCTWDNKEKNCIIGNEADCKGSQQCKDAGRCQFYKGFCVHETPDPCEEKDDCYQQGHCSSKNGKCVPASDLDCKTSLLCLNLGQCKQDKAKEVCIASNSSDCRRSKGCKVDGNCTFNEKKQLCLPGSSEDCGQSQKCRSERKCDYFEGTCIRNN